MTKPGGTTARGYGHAHQKARKQWAPIVKRGNARCTRCGGLIEPGSLWDLDHSEDRSTYLGAAHRYCNRAAGTEKRERLRVERAAEAAQAIAQQATRERRVILLCGPPGAGKTTWARQTGLDVYDLDDGQWSGESQFRQHIGQLPWVADARAVVIRSGATLSARTKWAEMIGATETVVIPTPLSDCIARIKHRARLKQTIDVQVASAHRWWDTYEQGNALELVSTRTASPPTTARPRSREW